MKKHIGWILIVIITFSTLMNLSACGNNKNITVPSKQNQTQSINKTFYQYGLVDVICNTKNAPDPRIQYKLIIGNVIWACILSETIITPAIIVGWYLYEPVSYDPDYSANNLN